MKSLKLYIGYPNKLKNRKNKNQLLSWYPDDQIENLNEYVEKNKYRLRKKYIYFVENLGSNKILNSKLNKIFLLDKFHNIWNYSLISEKCPIKSPQIANCLKLISLEEILVKRKIKKLYLYSSDHKITNSIESLCKKRLIKLIIKKSRFHYSTYKINKIYNTLKAFYYIMRIGLKYLVLYKRKKSSFNHKYNISIFSYLLNYDVIKVNNQKHFFYSKYWDGLPEKIKEKNEKINWFHQHVGFENSNRKLKEIYNLNSKNEDHKLIYEFLNLNIYFYSIYSFIKILIEVNLCGSVIKFFDLRNSKVNLWPLLYDDWNKSFNGSHLFYSLIMIRIFDNILSKIPNQKLGLYLYENQAWEKILLNSWNKYSHGTIIGVAHSTIRFWDLRYFSENIITKKNKAKLSKHPDYIAVNGRLAHITLVEGNSSMPEILKTEALRYFHLKNKKLIKSKINKEIKKILIVGDIDRANTKSLISALDLNCNNLKKYNISFRGHPGAPLINEAKKQGLKISNETNIFNDITKNDLVVVSGSSSVAIEALLMERSVIVYLSYDQLNMSPASELNGIKFAKSPQELHDLIISCKGKKNAINKNIFWLNKNLNNWNKHLNKLLNE